MNEIESAYEAVKTHVEEMLRGFRSGVAVYEEHLTDLLDKIDRLGHHVSAPAAAPPAPSPVMGAATSST